MTWVVYGMAVVAISALVAELVVGWIERRRGAHDRLADAIERKVREAGR